MSKFAGDAIINPLLREREIIMDLDAKKINVATQEIQNILQAGKEKELLNYSDLTSFVKIILIVWDDPYLKNRQEALINQLISLAQKIALEDEERASEFMEVAMMLIKKHEMTRVPNDISEPKVTMERL